MEDETRSVRKAARFTPTEAARIEQAAESDHRSISFVLRRGALAYADRLLARKAYSDASDRLGQTDE